MIFTLYVVSVILVISLQYCPSFFFYYYPIKNTNTSGVVLSGIRCVYDYCYCSICHLVMFRYRPRKCKTVAASRACSLSLQDSTILPRRYIFLFTTPPHFFGGAQPRPQNANVRIMAVVYTLHTL